MGCDKVAEECRHCYIDEWVRKFGYKPWGELHRTITTWGDPKLWDHECAVNDYAMRVFTCSLSDFFHVKADPWRDEAWAIIKKRSRLAWLILTKRPELIARRLPADWGDGYKNVWLGVLSNRELVVLVEWTVRDQSGKAVWIETVQGSASRHGGNAFTYRGNLKHIVKDSVQDMAEESAAKMSFSPELLKVSAQPVK